MTMPNTHHPRCSQRTDHALRCSCERESTFDLNRSTDPLMWLPLFSLPIDGDEPGSWFVCTQAGDDHHTCFATWGEASHAAMRLNHGGSDA